MLDVLSGYKTYIAAAGLLGLAVYQLSQGDLNGALQNLLAALAAFGLRSAIGRKETLPPDDEPPVPGPFYRQQGGPEGGGE